MTMTNESVFERARQVLDQAQALRMKVREDLRLKQFDADDLRMDAYNDLINMGASLFQDDPVLSKMILMPDANLKWRLQFGPVPPAEVGSERLEARLSQFINRLELILGESGEAPGPTRPAREVLAQEESADVTGILKALEALRSQQASPPRLELLDFDFIANPELRQVLKLDFEEAQRAFAAGGFKASSILAGGLIEGMLLDRFQKPDTMSRPGYAEAVGDFARVGADVNWDRVGLAQLLQAARELNILTESALRLAEGAHDFRNTVHPNAELREQIRAGREEAELLLALVKLVYRDLAT